MKPKNGRQYSPHPLADKCTWPAFVRLWFIPMSSLSSHPLSLFNFDPEYVTLDEFNGDAMSVPGVIGISYGIVVNTNIVEECTEGFVLHDGTHITRQNTCYFTRYFSHALYRCC